MKINFNIEPVSQLRPKFSARPFPHEYDPPKVKKYKVELHRLAVKAMSEQKMKPLEGSIAVTITFYRAIQKSVSKAEHERRVNGQTLPNVKPDVDNYVKSLLDALNGAVWSDDAMITDLSAKKRYSEKPHIELEVMNLA